MSRKQHLFYVVATNPAGEQFDFNIRATTVITAATKAARQVLCVPQLRAYKVSMVRQDTF